MHLRMMRRNQWFENLDIFKLPRPKLVPAFPDHIVNPALFLPDTTDNKCTDVTQIETFKDLMGLNHDRKNSPHP